MGRTCGFARLTILLAVRQAISVVHFLLLTVHLAADEQLAIQMAAKLKKHCTRMDEGVYCS